MESRGKRLGEWVDRTFATRTEGARACGLTPQGLNDYLSERKAPGAEALARMAAAGLDVGWYLTGSSTPTAGTSATDRGETGIVSEPTTSFSRESTADEGDRLAELFGRALDAPMHDAHTLDEWRQIAHHAIEALAEAARRR
jgi:transcriptional regulator with XRE-family HTH domain